MPHEDECVPGTQIRKPEFYLLPDSRSFLILTRACETLICAGVPLRRIERFMNEVTTGDPALAFMVYRNYFRIKLEPIVISRCKIFPYTGENLYLQWKWIYTVHVPGVGRYSGESMTWARSYAKKSLSEGQTIVLDWDGVLY